MDIFPPTDFHTSTYFADPTTGKESLIIIGGIGYPGQASRYRTGVYQLDLMDFSIRRVDTTGAGPIGGTDHHKAELIIEPEQAVMRITMEELKGTVDTLGGVDFITTELRGTSIVREESGVYGPRHEPSAQFVRRGEN